MFRTTLKSINAHKRRLLATCTAVLLGVAFLSGTLVLGDTVRANFTDLFEESNAGIDADVRGSNEVGSDDFTQRNLLDASLVDRIRGVDGVADAVPDIEAPGQIIGSDGDPLGGNGPPTIAGNWIENPRRRARSSSTAARPRTASWTSATRSRSAHPSPSRGRWSASPPSARPTRPAPSRSRRSPPTTPSRSCCPIRTR